MVVVDSQCKVNTYQCHCQGVCRSLHVSSIIRVLGTKHRSRCFLPLPFSVTRRVINNAFWPQQRIGFLFVGPCRVIYTTVELTAPAALVLLAWTTVTGNVLLAFCTNTEPAFKTTKVGAVNFCACVVSRGLCRWCLCGRFAVALTLGEFLGRCPAAYLA